MRQKRNLIYTWFIVALMFVAMAPAFAEKEIHVQNPDRSISIMLERTPREQAMAEHAYVQPDGNTIYYLDSQTGQPTTKENFQATYEAQMSTVRDSNNRIAEEAHDAFKQGVISHDEFMKQHGIVQMANAGLEVTRNQTVSTLQNLKSKPTNETADGRIASRIIVQKPKVLVSG